MTTVSLMTVSCPAPVGMSGDVGVPTMASSCRPASRFVVVSIVVFCLKGMVGVSTVVSGCL